MTPVVSVPPPGQTARHEMAGGNASAPGAARAQHRALSAQAEYQVRILPAAAAQFAAETSRRGHNPPACLRSTAHE